MPFTPVTDMPNAAPDVRIYFHGLLILRSEDGATCEVGVHPSATNHSLSIEVRTRRPQKPDVIHMRHFGNLHGRGPGMTMEVSSFAGTPVAYKHTPATPPDFDTGQGVDTDFRWVMNLEGALFHERQLDSDVFRTQHHILLRGGEYFFHTADRTSGLPIVREGGGKPERPLASIASIVGANLYLHEGQCFVVRWNDGRKEQTLPLEKPAAGIVHEVYVENSPLFEEQSAPQRHSELRAYYQIIKGHGSAEFNLRMDGEVEPANCDVSAAPAKFSPRDGSARIPCQSITLDG